MSSDLLTGTCTVGICDFIINTSFLLHCTTTYWYVTCNMHRKRAHKLLKPHQRTDAGGTNSQRIGGTGGTGGAGSTVRILAILGILPATSIQYMMIHVGMIYNYTTPVYYQY